MRSETQAYLKERYREMAIPQLELIINQINRELDHHPTADRTELCIAVEVLDEKKKDLRDQKKKKGRPCLPSRLEHQMDVGEEF